jgi:glycosyltransferase involved in cell wall biosynthesis
VKNGERLMLPIEWIGFFNETGYGQAAFDLVCALLETKKYNIRLISLNGSLSKNFLSKNSYNKLESLIKKPINSKSVQVYHCIPPMQLRLPRTYKSLGFATFETFDPPSSWVNMLNRLDGVICPSDFNYKVFAHSGVKKPLFHLPHCVDTRFWHKDVTRLNFYDKYTFLFVASWKRRKGWPALVEAFLREFNAQDKVQLLIKTDKSQLAHQDVEKIKSNLKLKKEYPTVIFEKRIFDDEYLPSFYKSADCLVLPTLGEGFGLPALQSMSVKVPVIVTNFSGCQEYASKETCTLIEPSGFIMHSNMDQISQFSNKKWPIVTVDSIRQSLRTVINNRQEIDFKADKAYENVHNNFCYSVAARKFDKIMESINCVN